MCIGLCLGSAPGVEHVRTQLHGPPFSGDLATEADRKNVPPNPEESRILSLTHTENVLPGTVLSRSHGRLPQNSLAQPKESQILSVTITAETFCPVRKKCRYCQGRLQIDLRICFVTDLFCHGFALSRICFDTDLFWHGFALSRICFSTDLLCHGFAL